MKLSSYLIVLAPILSCVSGIAPKQQKQQPLQLASNGGNSTRHDEDTDLDARARNMPMKAALSVLREKKGVTKDLLAFIESELSESRKASQGTKQKQNLRHGNKNSEEQLLSSDPSTLGKAEELISSMIEEAEIKLDAVEVGCVDFEATQREELESNRQSIADGGAKAAGYRAEKLRASAEIAYIDSRQPQLLQELKRHIGQCAEDSERLETQLGIMQQDLTVMETILKVNECGGEKEDKALLQIMQCCNHSKHSKGGGSGMSLFMARTRQSPLGQLRSAVAQFLVDEMFPTVHLALGASGSNAAGSSGAHRVALGQQAGAMSVMDYYVLQGDNSTVETQTQTPSGPTEPVAKASLCPNKAATRCTISDHPNCLSIQNKFMEINGGIIEKKRELQREMQETTAYCKEAQGTMESQLRDYEDRRTEEDGNMAAAAGEINKAEDTLRMLQERGGTLRKEYDLQLHGCKVLFGQIKCDKVENAGECANTIAEYQTEICGLKRIRMELARMQNSGIYSSDIIDCVVSAWRPLDCTVSCGGGIRKKVRDIDVNPNKEGAQCPPLEMKEACNMLPCPVDCVADEWSEWSACSASCAGGVRERTRRILTEAAFEGISCGGTAQTENCNIGSCDIPCELGDWSDWCDCDKACGGGSQRRTREVVREAGGDGECWGPDHSKRLEFQTCAVELCEDIYELNDTHPILSCGSKVDVLLLLDGSGSLGEEGWEATVAAAKRFTNAMLGGPEQVELAILLFSGPRNRAAQNICLGETSAPETGWDEMEGCGMKWVHHFTEDMSSVTSAIDAMTYPRGGTLTAKALDFANAELSNGRVEANTVIIVISDGMPTDKDNMIPASNAVKEMARLIFVLVGLEGGSQTEKVEEWVSKPASENMIMVADSASLPEPPTINAIITDFCMDLS